MMRSLAWQTGNVRTLFRYFMRTRIKRVQLLIAFLYLASIFHRTFGSLPHRGELLYRV